MKPFDVAALFELPGHVHVAVYKAGHHPFLTEVDQFIGFVGFDKAIFHLHDTPVFDDDGHLFAGRVGDAIDEMACMDDGFAATATGGSQ
ncbi:MAG: hypothetical protein Q9P14_05130 [candidate division KSB1 bacterium]|nr:hypothetical protein [candidate division KSB1 bacterium]